MSSTLRAHRSFPSTSNIYTRKNPINLRFYTTILYYIKIPYTEDDVREALEAVANGQSIRKASLTWGVPRMTLQDRLYGKESRSQAFINLQKLPPIQESRLVDWILLQGVAGHPPTHMQIRDLAQRILATTGKTTILGKKWMHSFLKRHPKLRTTRNTIQDSGRINRATTQVIRPWFNRFYIPDVHVRVLCH